MNKAEHKTKTKGVVQMLIRIEKGDVLYIEDNNGMNYDCSFNEKTQKLELEVVEGVEQMGLTRTDLHKVEMELVNLCDDNTISREAIIDKFTELMNEVE